MKHSKAIKMAAAAGTDRCNGSGNWLVALSWSPSVSCAESAASWRSHTLSSASAGVRGENEEIGAIIVLGRRDLNITPLPSPPKHTPLAPFRHSLYFGMSWEKHATSVTDNWVSVGERPLPSNVAHLNFQMKPGLQGRRYHCKQLRQQRLFVT